MSRVPVSAAEDAATASPLTGQLRRGFRWLRFEPSLETIWRAEQFRDGLGSLRAGLLILAAVILTINQLDSTVLPALSEVAPHMAGIGVMPPMLVLGFLLTFLPNGAAWYSRVMPVAIAAVLAIVSWVAIEVWALGEARVLVRVAIGTIAIYFVLGLPFRSAFAVNLAGLAFFAAVAVASEMPGDEVRHYVSMLLMTNVICAVGAYNLEYASRTAWLEGKLLAETALQDGLTGIHNRRRFDEHLERTWQQAQRDRRPLSLLFADIDFFKKYNDRYGHQAGDEALKAVAGVLAHHARRPLDLAARCGGEEFGVILYDARREHVGRVAEEILDQVRALHIVHADAAARGLLTISIGIATVFPEKRRSAAGLLQLADQALYAAKDSGRDRARALDADYEHMKTGYFYRRLEPGGRPGPEG